MEHPSHRLPIPQFQLVLLILFIYLRSKLVIGNSGVSEDSSVIDLTIPSTHLVSQFRDASINGYSVKLESFEYREPTNQLLFAHNSMYNLPETEPVSTIVVQNASFSQLYIGEVSAKTQYMFVFNYTEGGKVRVI